MPCLKGTTGRVYYVQRHRCWSHFHPMSTVNSWLRNGHVDRVRNLQPRHNSGLRSGYDDDYVSYVPIAQVFITYWAVPQDRVIFLRSIERSA
jgi:hypothetical protein